MLRFFKELKSERVLRSVPFPGNVPFLRQFNKTFVESVSSEFKKQRFPLAAGGMLPSSAVDILEEIRRVLDIEIEGLQSVRSNLSSHFARAVEMIASAKGHVYVTGAGKSGIIATKIGATLRSTGTPAKILHTSEALHGDGGMVGKDDVVQSIGESGETTELDSLVRIRG